VISEIKKLTDEDLICTQPNRGYQWVAPTKVIAVEHNEEIEQVKLSGVKTKTVRSGSLQTIAMATSIVNIKVYFYLVLVDFWQSSKVIAAIILMIAYVSSKLKGSRSQ
jgi:hypothetical protein